jgi:hypothetical protein
MGCPGKNMVQTGYQKTSGRVERVDKKFIRADCGKIGKTGDFSSMQTCMFPQQ